MNIRLPSSKLQASIASELENQRKIFLQEALCATVQTLEIKALNDELDQFAPAADLANLASRGVRGELLFATPLLLTKNPRLLGYYRLLLGFSQKEFYQKSKLARFESMEAKGEISSRIKSELEPLCQALIQRASEMASLIGFAKISLQLLDNLTLLTLGPQMRGSRNTQIGKEANQVVFNLIEQVVAHAVRAKQGNLLELLNASKRKVRIIFGSDPDIRIQEEISSATTKNIVAIEIKGGADKSNIWNRLGEAEKSHQSAKQNGCVEFWTIYNVSNLDLAMAREKSPTTTRFFELQAISTIHSAAYEDFRDRLVSLVGIKAARAKPSKTQK
ncbi:MAG: XcyI family restriction endonuclease [Verrucomicrobiota bacterium]